MKLDKVVLVLVILLFVLCIFLVVVGGIYIVYGVKLYKTFKDDKANSPEGCNSAIGLGFLGILLVLIGVYGIFASISGRFIHLIILVLALLVIIALQLLFAIMTQAYMKLAGLKNKRHTELHFRDAILVYYRNKRAKDYVDRIQSESKCCGMDDSRDWSHEILPTTCCEFDDPCVIDHTDYKIGCPDAVVDRFEGEIQLIVYLEYAFILLEILAVLVAIVLLIVMKLKLRCC